MNSLMRWCSLGCKDTDSPSNRVEKIRPQAMKPPRESSRSSSSSEIHVDSDTTVPVDLYMSLMQAGKNAKSRGQHKLARNKQKEEHLVSMDLYSNGRSA
mmetsp:Transcript_12608/g.21933  ORF Transcript_12608/g.21933 Transcript_12608/m.21933 type:complete len:99 (+) Transcript_12608:98-394(+)